MGRNDCTSGRKEQRQSEMFPPIQMALVPSTWDMFNITAVEHLLHKKPLLCSKAAGVSDFLIFGAAMLFDNTPKDLANALEKVMDSAPCELQRMTRKRVQFSDERIFERIHFPKTY